MQNPEMGEHVGHRRTQLSEEHLLHAQCQQDAATQARRTFCMQGGNLGSGVRKASALVTCCPSCTVCFCTVGGIMPECFGQLSGISRQL